MSYKRSRRAFEADLTARESPFVTYGTPLSPLDDKARDDGSYLPVWKQEVTDARGRKRLHGAFTGGFSAGYFNTVGSKEGWTPANFVSSRANRYKDSKNAQQQRPEDFMDDEDMAEAEEARTLETKSAYAAFGSTAGDERRQGFLMDLLRPQTETIGTKLLRRMGWRDGQGIGARVRRKASSGTISQEVPNSTEDELSAPINTALITFDRKNDRRGLGYSAEAQLGASSSEKQETDTLNMSNKERNRVGGLDSNTKEHGVRKGGFGVGVINSMESDEDDDPFTVGPKIHYNRVIGGDKQSKLKSKEKKNAVNAANPLLRNKPIFVSRKPAQAEFRKCHDGRLPLTGFLLGLSSGMESIQIDESKYPMPKIPKDWKSQKSSVGSLGSSDKISTVDLAKQSTLDPKSRAALLGEAQLPGKSVFDFLSPAARDRIAAASGRDNLPAALGHNIPSDHNTGFVKQVSDLDAIPFIDKAVAIAALGRGIGGWMPYSEDEAKRGRYQAFLRYRGELTESQPQRSKNLSREDWLRELEEFAHAAKVFKPMTGAIASRFTTSSMEPGSRSKESDADSTTLLRTVVQKAEDPAEAAAKINMFGPMTRSVHQFYPTRLVCKRFNVKPPPHVQLDADASAKAEANPLSRQDRDPSKIDDLVSQSTMEQLVREAQIATSSKEQGAQASTHSEGKLDPEPGLQIDASRNDALEGARAGESVFKAIFGSDDEDD